MLLRPGGGAGDLPCGAAAAAHLQVLPLAELAAARHWAAPTGRSGEQALDVQFLAQFAEGSGASVGFAASSADPALANVTLDQVCSCAVLPPQHGRAAGGAPLWFGAPAGAERHMGGRAELAAQEAPPPTLLPTLWRAPSARWLPQVYLGLLGLRPLPDVMSWSWGNAATTPDQKPFEAEAVLAKVGPRPAVVEKACCCACCGEA